MKGIPERWEQYLPMGCRVPGTRFLPFKVPLKPELCRKHPEEEWFTPSMLLENTPMLKAVIDLTNTNRYYNSEEFTKRGVLYKKIFIQGGGRIPSRCIREKFFDAVDQLSRTLDNDSDALIGVHCTHGLNRTGYLICKYMVLRMKIDPQEAINKFQEARGYDIERKNYVSDIISGAPDWQCQQQNMPRHTRWRNEQPYVPESSRNWRTERQTSSGFYSTPNWQRGQQNMPRHTRWQNESTHAEHEARNWQTECRRSSGRSSRSVAHDNEKKSLTREPRFSERGRRKHERTFSKN